MNKRIHQIKIIDFFNKGHIRSQTAKKNIAASILIKGVNISVGLILVPLTINYLNPTKYGIWITLSSLIGWFSFFDIGLGNGLRNKFAEAVALSKHKLAKIYVSTSYAVISIIVIGLFIVFSLINPAINWNDILNADVNIVKPSELYILVQILFTFFCLGLIFKLITTILAADQKPAKASFFDLIGQLISLTLVFIITKISEGSLILLGLIMSASPVFVLLLSTLWFFSGKYKKYRPSFYFVKFNKARILFSLGIKFFFIQIAAIFLYQTNNIIITQLFGPKYVTSYNITFKYFSVITMFFSIILTPFWSAFTEAWLKSEILWIKRIISKLIILWFVLGLIGIIMILFSNEVFHIWIGENTSIPITISVLVYMWIMINTWNNIFSFFLNGVGKIKLQLHTGISAALINIPLAIIFGRWFGIEGVLLANIVCVSLGGLLYPIQYKKIITNKARGLWNE